MCFKDPVTHNESLLSRMYCMVIYVTVDVTIVIISFLLEYKWTKTHKDNGKNDDDLKRRKGSVPPIIDFITNEPTTSLLYSITIDLYRQYRWCFRALLNAYSTFRIHHLSLFNYHRDPLPQLYVWIPVLVVVPSSTLHKNAIVNGFQIGGKLCTARSIQWTRRLL